MTTAELIELLQQEDPSGKRRIVLQKDPEGNGYSDANYVDGNCRVRGEGEYVEIGIDKLTEELKDQGYSHHDVMSGGKPALVIAP